MSEREAGVSLIGKIFPIDQRSGDIISAVHTADYISTYGLFSGLLAEKTVMDFFADFFADRQYDVEKMMSVLHKIAQEVFVDQSIRVSFRREYEDEDEPPMQRVGGLDIAGVTVLTRAEQCRNFRGDSSISPIHLLSGVLAVMDQKSDLTTEQPFLESGDSASFIQKLFKATLSFAPVNV